MKRAFTVIVEDFLFLWLGKNFPLTETHIVKARAARVAMDGS